MVHAKIDARLATLAAVRRTRALADAFLRSGSKPDIKSEMSSLIGDVMPYLRVDQEIAARLSRNAGTVAKGLAMAGTVTLGFGIGAEVASGSPNILYNILETIMSPTLNLRDVGATAVVVGADLLEDAADIAIARGAVGRIRRWIANRKGSEGKPDGR